MTQERARALVLTRYESKGASSRVRLIQFVPTFEKFTTVRVQSLFSNSYVDGIGKRPKPAQLIYGFPGLVKRLAFLGMLIAKRRSFDLVILQQELFPFVPAWVESWMLRRIGAGNLIIDIDDGNQIRYQQSNLLVRALCGGKFEALWSRSKAVVCGSQQLLDDVIPHKGGNGETILIPSVPPESTLRIQRKIQAPPPFIIGWIGSPSTAEDLSIIRKPLTEISEDFDIELHVVGAEIESSQYFKISCSPWTHEAELNLLRRMHVGVMPLAETEYRKRKCGYKLIQYMSAGLPVVASDVGGNADIIAKEMLRGGFIAASDDDWSDALRRLISDDFLRDTVGSEAKQIATEWFSFHEASSKWTDLLQEILKT